MIVKVCGVRTAEVARAAVEAGADWIGLVFEPASPRHATDDEARRVADAVADRADLVGVLVGPGAELCDELGSRHRLAAVQVHGEVPASLPAVCSLPVIRAFNVGSARDAFTLDWWPDLPVMIDAAPEHGGLPGGTGRSVPRAVAAEAARHRRVLLAGGLGPGNVGDVIARVRPWGVDASGALETSPGVKDAELVRAFVRAARAAFELVAEPRAAVAARRGHARG